MKTLLIGKRFQQWVLSLLIPAFAMVGSPVQGNPQGGVAVTQGVQFQGLGTANLNVITGAQNSIINWQSFSIQNGEVTNFQQPNAASVSLNRVMAGNPSAIHGTLSSNGGIILINPSGIVVGPGGMVDVAGMMTMSTLDMTNEDFLDGGASRFYGDSDAGITNMGVISSRNGDVVLLGGFVDNQGQIGAMNGTVALGSGGDILLQESGESRISVKGSSDYTGTGVNNATTGVIQGAAVELKAHGNVYALAINNGGAIRASGATRSNGRVRLMASGGSGNINLGNASTIVATTDVGGGSVEINSARGNVALDGLIDVGDSAEGGSVSVVGNTVTQAASSKVEASGGSLAGSVKIDAVETVTIAGNIEADSIYGEGGEVIITGGDISVEETTRVDARGYHEGGTLRIGGDFQGRDTGLREADTLVVERGATFTVSAAMGDGGTAVFWSNVDTLFEGDVAAGANGMVGNGGFIEISGKERLGYDGIVRAGSLNGRNGTLLLDPNDAYVGGVAPAGERSISISSINSALQGRVGTDAEDQGTNFFVVSEGNIYFQADDQGGFDTTGNVSNDRHSAVQWTNSDTSFGAFAAGDVVVNNHIRTSGGGSISLIGGWGGDAGDAVIITLESPEKAFDTYVQDGKFGLNGGSVFIGSGDQLQHVVVGSRFGDTNVAGFNVRVVGSNQNAAFNFSQLGFHDGGNVFAPRLNNGGGIILDLTRGASNLDPANLDPQGFILDGDGNRAKDANGEDIRPNERWYLSDGVNNNDMALRGVGDPIVAIVGQNEVDMNLDGTVDGVHGINSTGVLKDTFVPYANHYNSVGQGNWWWQQIEDLGNTTDRKDAQNLGGLRPENGAGLLTNGAAINVLARRNVDVIGGSGREQSSAMIGHGGTNRSNWGGGAISTRETGNADPNNASFSLAGVERNQIERRWSFNGSTTDRTSTSIARLAPVYGNINVLAGVDPDLERIVISRPAGGAVSKTTIAASVGTVGNVTVRGAQNFEESNESNYSYGQIGHGGTGQFGEFYGDIRVEAGNKIDVQAGNSYRSHASIGHTFAGFAYWNPTSAEDQQLRFFATVGDFDNPNLRRGELFTEDASTGFNPAIDPLRLQTQQFTLFNGVAHGSSGNPTGIITITKTAIADQGGLVTLTGRMKATGVATVSDLVSEWNTANSTEPKLIVVAGGAEEIAVGQTISFTSELARYSKDYLPSKRQYFYGEDGDGSLTTNTLIASTTAGTRGQAAGSIRLVGNGNMNLAALVKAWNDDVNNSEDIVIIGTNAADVTAIGNQVLALDEELYFTMDRPTSTTTQHLQRLHTGLPVGERDVFPELYTFGTSGRNTTNTTTQGERSYAPLNLAPKSTVSGMDDERVSLTDLGLLGGVEALDGSTISGLHGDVTVKAHGGDITVEGYSTPDAAYVNPEPRDRRFAAIGHGGFEWHFGSEGSGFRNLDGATQDVGGTFNALEYVQYRINDPSRGTGTLAQVGAGTSMNRGLQMMSLTGDIDVDAEGDVSVIAGNDSFDLARIGHGGVQVADPETSSFILGDIRVHAGGDILVQGGGAIANQARFAANRTVDYYAYGQIGHGGYQSGFFGQVGDMDVKADGNVTVRGGAFTGTVGKIGHQLFDDRGQSGGNFTRNENFYRDNKPVDVVSTLNNTDAKIEYTFYETGTPPSTSAQTAPTTLVERNFDKAAKYAAGDLIGDQNTADISVVAGQNVTVEHMQIGRRQSVNQKLYEDNGGTATVDPDAQAQGSRTQNSMAMIGHGGIRTDSIRDDNPATNFGDKIGNITVTATAGDVMVTNGEGINRSSRIGHGFGTFINTNATESPDVANGARIGSESTALELAGDITVTAGGSVYVDASAADANERSENSDEVTGIGGVSDFNPVTIGHGGTRGNQDIVVLDTGAINGIVASSDISIVADGNLEVVGGNGARNSSAQVGHGFASDQGNDFSRRLGVATGFNGDISVDVKGDLRVEGGSQAVIINPGASATTLEVRTVRGAYAAIGNGGFMIDAPSTGDISVYVGGSAVVRGQVRNDVYNAGITDPVDPLYQVVNSTGGQNTIGRNVPASAFNFGKIGHFSVENGERVANNNDTITDATMDGDITVVVNGNLSVLGGVLGPDAGTPDPNDDNIDLQTIYGAFGQIGHGGPSIRDSLSGEITVLVKGNLAVTGGVETTAASETQGKLNNYAMIGHGDSLEATVAAASSMFRGSEGKEAGGNIIIATGNNAAFNDAQIGHVDPKLVNDSTTTGVTQIAVSRLNPFYGGTGVLSAVNETYFGSGENELVQFFMPSRGNASIATSTRINSDSGAFSSLPGNFAAPFDASLEELAGREDEVYLTPDLWWDEANIAADLDEVGGAFPTAAVAGVAGLGGAISTVTSPGGLLNLDTLAPGALGSSAPATAANRDNPGRLGGLGAYTFFFDAIEPVATAIPIPVITTILPDIFFDFQPFNFFEQYEAFTRDDGWVEDERIGGELALFGGLGLFETNEEEVEESGSRKFENQLDNLAGSRRDSFSEEEEDEERKAIRSRGRKGVGSIGLTYYVFDPGTNRYSSYRVFGNPLESFTPAN